MTQEAQYHTIPIKDEPLLTKYGFTEFRLPLNHNATKMVLYNDKDPSMITYVDFDRHNLDKSVQLLHDKLVDDQQVETRAGNDTLQGLIAYFRNTCHSLKEDSSNEFFKNGNGKSGNKARKKSEPQDPKKEIFAQRYVVDNSIAEAVIVGGRPKFAITVPKVGYPDQISSIALHDAIEIGEDMVIKPPEFISYINKPHVFKSEQEFQDLVANIKTKDLDALYK